MAREHKKAANHGNAKRRTAQRTPKRKAVAKPYEQTPEERVAVAAMAARKKELPVAPRMKVPERRTIRTSRSGISSSWRPSERWNWTS